MQSSIYSKIEDILKHSDKPLTCTELFDKSEIRQEVNSTDEVSDRLGYLWRRGLVTRVPSPKLGVKSARYAYSWRNNTTKARKPVSIDDVTRRTKFNGLDAKRSADGSIVLTSDEFEIVIRKRYQ